MTISVSSLFINDLEIHVIWVGQIKKGIMSKALKLNIKIFFEARRPKVVSLMRWKTRFAIPL